MNQHQHPSSESFLAATSGRLEEFLTQLDRETGKSDCPHAIDIRSNIPVYDGANLAAIQADGVNAHKLMSEWINVLRSGAGVIIISSAYQDTSVIDEATRIFNTIIADEKASMPEASDHFAVGGANDRVWNALEKHCRLDPENFVRYYSNAALAMVSTAWLGPGYQMTAQVNLVRPGGKAQTAHRDYHLGFMAPTQMEKYPAHIHDISPVLTLQGAVAHCDMPIESGPTMLLPFSQQFREGYLAFGREEFQKCFHERYVQAPLEKGDLVFFNPALMHGAGNNTSKNIERMANLLQVSSAFGRAMESVDRRAMARTLYPVIGKMLAGNSLTWAEAENAIACSAEGYPFPVDLDLKPPAGGLAPQTDQALMKQALEEKMPLDKFVEALG